MTAHHSCLYEGTIRHRRFRPVENSFQYRLFLVYLDLAELDTVFAGRLLWGTRRGSVAAFCREDHLGDPAVPLDRAVRDLVAARTGRSPDGPIRLLTHLRYLGHCFNPVSFYYCFDPSGSRLEVLVAEVNNTPWGERHCYVLDDRPAPPAGRWRQHSFPKVFHVSPFFDLTMTYDWRYSEPGPTLGMHLADLDRATGERMFDATLTLRRRPITTRSLARMLVVHPWMTARVTALIYWQALRLWWKGAPFFVHPSKREPPPEVFHVHQRP